MEDLGYLLPPIAACVTFRSPLRSVHVIPATVRVSPYETRVTSAVVAVAAAAEDNLLVPVRTSAQAADCNRRRRRPHFPNQTSPPLQVNKVLPKSKDLNVKAEEWY